MSKLVTIYGGSGFVGRYIARLMAKEGWRVRVAVRRPNEALFVKPYGAVGQVEPVLCNIRDDESVRLAMAGADAVVNCVGILAEAGPNKFDAVQNQGAERVARIAAAEGIGQLVQISAIGADENSESAYARSKALGEQGVVSNFPNAVILRPSVIFGTEDEFFNRFASMASLMPVVNLVGGNTKFQPVYVEDVARAAVKGVLGQAEPGIYELGGPDVKTLREIVSDITTEIQRRRIVINLPFFVGNIIASVLDAVKAVTLGLFANPILTRDQVKNLRVDNVVADDAKTFADLGIEPTDYEAVIGDYLWRFRDSGQYAAIKNSAKNLKA